MLIEYKSAGKNFYSKPPYSKSSIDWKRTLLFCAVFFVLFNSLIWLIGFKGIFVGCLIIIAWYFLPRIYKDIRRTRQQKRINQSPTVTRIDLMDFNNE